MLTLNVVLPFSSTAYEIQKQQQKNKKQKPLEQEQCFILKNNSYIGLTF